MNLGRLQWLLYAFVALIVMAPYFLVKQANQRVQLADQMLAHTNEVEATTSRLLYELRDLEAAASTLTAGVDGPNIRRRIAESEQAILPALDKLTELTQDNPHQQIQVGELRARIYQRVQLTSRIIAEQDPKKRHRLLELMITEFPIRGAANGVMKEEAYLLERRSADALHVREQASWFSLASMLVQLVLLSLLLWMALRHQKQRAHAEQTARTADARALAVMQAVREPIALIDHEQRVVMHNAAFVELYGGEAQDGTSVDGEKLADIGGDAWSNRETLQRLRDVLSRGRELWDFEIQQTTADGIERTMLLNARRMQLPDRPDEVALLTLSDVSSLKAAELEISDLNRQLQGKVEQISDVNRELEAFSYSVSHDLRAPLRHISGFAEKLERYLGYGADEKARHYIGTIDSAARRMATLIDDLLVYSRLGRSALRLQPVDMQSLVAETRALLDSNIAIDTPGRQVEWKIDSLPMVIADENMMRQVWLNLLGNAVKYSAPREHTRIEVTHERLPDGRHAFSVADNGVGFDMQYASKLFGVFQRMHKASEFPGTGIGLASVQRVLMRHHGQISADSRLGEGSRFRFVLPSILDTPDPTLLGAVQ